MVDVLEIKDNDYVYDISLDGTFVNAFGCNVLSNTDGFNFKMPPTFRYTKEHPYISNGNGRNSIEGKEYVGVDADVAEFEDLYFNKEYKEGGINKMGLGIDEYCPSTINFSRKNYSDLLENGKTKKVGNTIKSRKMSGYIENFLEIAIEQLLHGKGKEFIESYYDYIDKIYNYQIPLKDIASKGKIKKTIEDYIKDCQTTTKSGSKKSRQAWYELVIKEGMKVDIDDTIYYVNTGVKLSESDVKRITRQYAFVNGKYEEITTEFKKKALQEYYHIDGKVALNAFNTSEIKEALKPYIAKEEDEIILNCKIVPRDIVESEEDIMCNDDIEYNVVKYIDQFNKRIKPLLVCFSPSIRDKILIDEPSKRQYFTEEECELVSGYPYKESDQDTYEQLMTPERKEIEFWLSINERPPFVEECGIEWDKLVDEYKKTKESENDSLFQIENEKYLSAIEKLTNEETEKFYDSGELPKSLKSLVTVDNDSHFKFIKIPNMSPSTGGYMFDDIPYLNE